MYHQGLNSKDYEIISNRLELLFDCLWYCSRYQETKRKSIFTVSERILINQERGALMSQQALILYPEDKNEVRDFTVPETLETKIQFIKTKL